ncbi:YcaO-like family protein [Bradyrhizobium canariense]|uniref:Ribosomal protein S12 methylthiotransferase accessory factor n=1 Tax=Bradyrhizobium canariense TaxID=255045 RepID=A0A1H1UCE4_9BRAD|nr:YcaO-like family protein [Bradyrhizobium canariense]SDS69599.1 ribosomal protein S12 methylthiotransferase accessory factor [Bradyrhizobium canariense]
MPNLFARAASSLLGDRPEAADDADVRSLLQALGYAREAGADRTESGPETRHRACLLKLASRFRRVFELAAPDAPGLVIFGAEFDPELADPLHAGSPGVGVSGVGLSLQEAFQGCIGEGVEYLSQLQTANDVLELPGAAGPAAGLGPAAREFLATFSAYHGRADVELSWCRVTRLTDGREVLLPADLCLRRPSGKQAIKPPFPLSAGSAAGRSWDAAALHGLLELIERDAASLWWRGGNRGRLIPPEHEAQTAARVLLSRLRQNVSSRRSWLLDITTDIGVPCVAAVSCKADGLGFAFGLAARPTLAAAVRSAVLEMCQIELAHEVVEAKCTERGEAALNERDRIHRRRATMIVADECLLLQPVAERAEHLNFNVSDPGALLRLMADRLDQFGIETFNLNLTRPHFAIPVARVIAPGLQLEPSELITPRLADMIAQTGGGASYTGGVALI